MEYPKESAAGREEGQRALAGFMAQPARDAGVSFRQ
jgi:hypothetical protein